MYNIFSRVGSEMMLTSMDTKAKINMGILSVNRFVRIVRFQSNPTRIPDHDFTLAPDYKLLMDGIAMLSPYIKKRPLTR